MIADLALAVRGIEQRGDASSERGGVIGDGEFPRVRQKDSNHFSRSETSGDEAASERFDEAAIFGESETSIAGSVNQCRLAAVLAAGIENNIVD